jgi:signal peptidase I
MNPSKNNLDLVLVKKLSYDFENPRRGDVVVFYDYSEDDFLIKRVIAIAGDTVEIIDGDIFINDVLHEDLFSHNKIGNYHDDQEAPLFLSSEEKISVPKDHVWVIGDNRRDTWYGLVPIYSIIGGLEP